MRAGEIFVHQGLILLACCQNTMKYYLIANPFFVFLRRRKPNQTKPTKMRREGKGKGLIPWNFDPNPKRFCEAFSACFLRHSETTVTWAIVK